MCLIGRLTDDELPDDHNLMLVISMVRVSRIEKVKLGVVDLILEKMALIVWQHVRVIDDGA